MARTRAPVASGDDRMTVLCRCGMRVRSEVRRLRRAPPCPSCRKPLPFRAEPKDGRRIEDVCRCGLKASFPRERAGLWIDCPRCGDRRILPGHRVGVKKEMPVELPPERGSMLVASSRRSGGKLWLWLLLLVIAAAAAAWKLGYLPIP